LWSLRRLVTGVASGSALFSEPGKTGIVGCGKVLQTTADGAFHSYASGNRTGGRYGLQQQSSPPYSRGTAGRLSALYQFRVIIALGLRLGRMHPCSTVDSSNVRRKERKDSKNRLENQSGDGGIRELRQLYGRIWRAVQAGILLVYGYERAGHTVGLWTYYYRTGRRRFHYFWASFSLHCWIAYPKSSKEAR
jgi:hypothetical protein